jgi:hypothetical protein
MSHIWANDEVGATDQPENIVIRYVSFFSSDFTLVYSSAFAQIFPRSQPMRESNTSKTVTEKAGKVKQLFVKDNP